MTDSLATKQDIHELGLATRQALEALAAATKHDIEALAAATRHENGALAAATRHDLIVLEERVNARFEIVDVRMVEMEKRFESRLGTGLADLERRLTMRLGGMMVAGIGVVSALVKVL